MDVAVSELRANLKVWLQLVRSGETIVVTERSTPIARLTAIDSVDAIEALVAQGVISAPGSSARPKARGAARITSNESASKIVSQLRR